MAEQHEPVTVGAVHSFASDLQTINTSALHESHMGMNSGAEEKLVFTMVTVHNSDFYFKSNTKTQHLGRVAITT